MTIISLVFDFYKFQNEVTTQITLNFLPFLMNKKMGKEERSKLVSSIWA